MGSCYCKQGPVIVFQSEFDVYVTAGKKEEDLKKEKITKLDIENLSPTINQSRQLIKESSNKKVRFSQDSIFEKDKVNCSLNKDAIRRRAKQKIFQSVKAPKELLKLNNSNNKLKLELNVDNNDSINKDADSILHFNSINGSEVSQTNQVDKEPKKKFIRRNVRSVTGIDKSMLNKKLINLEMSIPILTDALVIQQKGKLKENYEIIKKIGVGPLGAVYKAKNIYLKNIVAIKMIKRIKEKEDEKEELYIKNQINILKKLSHPNIVKMHEFYCNEKYYQLIMEYCKKGELFQYIKKSFTEKQLAVIFYQILSGLCYLHGKDIIHKNIKLKNIMIKDKEEDINTKEEYFWIKIVDFHTAEIFQRNIKLSRTFKNSYYNSPEELKNNYTKESDIWSVGVILYMALTGKVPFDGKTDEEINDKILSKTYNDLDPRLLAHSLEVRDLLDKLLEKDKNKRITAEDALKHEWFVKYQGRALFNNFRPEEIQQYVNNLCSYSCESKISQLVLAFIVHNIPETLSIFTILKLFRYFNLSGNCKLTKAELKKGLYNYRNEEQVNKIVDQLFLILDGDNNGFIEFEEFLRACVDKNRILTKENIWYAFKFLDDKNTNSIDVQTLMRAFDAKPNKMLEAVFNKTLNNGNLNNNGKITFHEFEQLILNTMKE